MIFFVTEELDVIYSKHQKKTLEIPVEPSMPFVAKVSISTAKAPTQKVAASKEGGRETASMERRKTLSVEKRKANRIARISKVSSSLWMRSFA